VDLLTAVSVSLLRSSRGRTCALFKELRLHDPRTSLERVVEALDLPEDEDRQSACADARARAASAISEAAAMEGVAALAWFDERYPPLLSCTTDPPPVLWVRGDPQAFDRPAVAIVGSRAATPYALDVATRLAAELAARGVVVVSGLARGVDSAAHRGCLEGGGRTVAVLGSGVDRVYPAEHKGLAAEIVRSGCVISELGPGAPPLPGHFPLRNRIISGISLAVVVVEASEHSGSLITARCALDQGRDVMAVPGNILTGRSRGSHSLLKDGAKVVESADDILEELGWPVAADGPKRNIKSLKTDPLLAQMEPGESYRLDELARTTGQAAPQLLARLTELELLGQVTSVGQGRFAVVPTRR
jgi:DNA processing protein